VKLLSFGADEDAGEDVEAVVFKKKSIVRPDRTFTISFHELFYTYNVDIYFEQWWKTQEQQLLYRTLFHRLPPVVNLLMS
jgi:hypothetical protein